MANSAGEIRDYWNRRQAEPQLHVRPVTAAAHPMKSQANPLTAGEVIATPGHLTRINRGVASSSSSPWFSRLDAFREGTGR